jgi:sporulation protein YlmC with PRC-barrel domain
MIDQASVPSLMGSTVRDNAGEKIGKVGQVYLDDTTGQPEWVTVRTGLFGTKESFVPLAAARVEGDELVVDIAKDRVSDAPKIDEDGHLSEEQETELYQYYGVSQGPFGRQGTPTAGGPTDSTYAGTETGRSGEGYPETDAGADYATTDAATGVAGTDYDRTDTATGVAGTDYDRTDAATGAAGYERPDGAGAAGLDERDRTPGRLGTAGTDAAVASSGAAGLGTTGVVGDPTGTPVGDVDVSNAFSGPGYGDEVPDEPEAGPDFARGQDGTVTGGPVESGPDFARGEDASVTRAQDTVAGPDYARGQDRTSTLGDTAAATTTGAGAVGDADRTAGAFVDADRDATTGAGAFGDADRTTGAAGAYGETDVDRAGAYGEADRAVSTGASGDPQAERAAADSTAPAAYGDTDAGRAAATGAAEPEPAPFKSRLRRWLSSDEPSEKKDS